MDFAVLHMQCTRTVHEFSAFRCSLHLTCSLDIVARRKIRRQASYVFSGDPRITPREPEGSAAGRWAVQRRHQVLFVLTLHTD